MNTKEDQSSQKRSPALDPLVVYAFQTVRYLSQLAEALSFEVLECDSPNAVRTQITHCADRAEHVAQEFVQTHFGAWNDNREFIRHSLQGDVEWMLELIEFDPVRKLLSRTNSAHPRREELHELAGAIRS